MNELNKLIEQYETENPGKRAEIWEGPIFYGYTKEFIKWLASRPTCGKEQRLFLNELEKNFETPYENEKTIQHKFGESLIEGDDFENICDLQKVMKGE